MFETSIMCKIPSESGHHRNRNIALNLIISREIQYFNLRKRFD